MKKIFLLLFITIALVSCDDDNDPNNNVCDETHVSDAIAVAFNSNVHNFIEFMDLQTHEYDIQINASGDICSIGYQQGSNYSGAYLMEILVNGTVAYSGSHTFAATMQDYQSISPVAITSGDLVTVRRTVPTGSFTNFNELTGPVLRRNDSMNIQFPVTAGTVDFLSSNFYGSGGPVPNIAMPNIGIGFELN